MLCILLAVLLIPIVISVTNEGNLHLLEEEIAAAIKTCADNKPNRQRRSSFTNITPKIDSNVQLDKNIYGHQRRSTNDTIDKIHVLNTTDYDYGSAGGSNASVKVVTDTPKEGSNRTKRNEPLIIKPDGDQVDVRGIPREAEFWNIVQFSVSSQQSRAALRDQIRSCFQELESEAEDDGCSYSNKLERCLMLQFDDRKTGNETAKSTP